ncbi:hypothetical protein VEZ01S_21_00010 [Vibrio ezurae NBRC 102218]|uniref:Cadherin domain-containing protein n=1 Tax=Vibrio ezurae NBRC 102218 TaxID=1219080 RepID=U3CP19_9VIBR|nr:hypothetical protein VEZ01S_21_00010 [Vibrio ezurae NBRC 102218]
MDGQVTATDVDHRAVLTYTPDNLKGVYGTFTLNSSSGKWHYTLDNNAHQALAQGESHVETMQVTVTDDQGATTTQQVTVTVEGTNDKPVLSADTHTGSVNEDGTLFARGQILATDADHNAKLTYTAGSHHGTYGDFTLNAGSGTWTYTLDNKHHQDLAAGETHTESMLVTVTDDKGATVTETVAVTVTGTNDIPVITSKAPLETVKEDGLQFVDGQVIATDVDHGAVLTYTPDSLQGQYGTFVLNASSGKWHYTLDNSANQALAEGESYTETMRVTVIDDKGATATQQITVTVEGTNDRPVITSQAQAETVKEDGVQAVAGQVTATDVDHGAVLTYTPDSLQGQYGTFLLDASSGQWKYTLDNAAHQALAEGESQTDTMLVTVTDDKGATTTQQVVVTVEGTNDVPKLQADTHTGSVTEDGTLSAKGQVLATDVDHNAQLAYSTSNSQGAYGDFTLDPTSGEWTYKLSNAQHQDLSEGEVHTESMLITVTDDKGATVTETVAVTVTGTNDQPVVTFKDNSADHTHGTLSFTDVDTFDTHTYAVSGSTISGDTQTIVGQFGDLVLDTKTGAYTYTQHPSVSGMSMDANGVYHGKEFFEVSTSDNHGGTSTKYLTFEPSMVASAPTKDGQPPVLTPVLNQAPELLDHQPVIAPITPPVNQFGALTIDPSSDTGTSDTDGITSVTTPSVTGHTDIPFSVVTLTDENGNVVATTTSNAQGDFNVALAQLSGSISGDTHHISGVALAPSATASVSTPTPLQLVIDTGIHTPSVDITDGTTQTTQHPNHIISGTELSNVEISGVIDHQGVETDLTGLTVTDEKGHVAHLDPTQATVDAKTGVFTLHADLSSYGLVDGTLTVDATATDLAGNTKQSTSTATLDTHPGSIAIDGTLSGDNVINALETQSPLTVSGTSTGIEAGQLVTIDFNNHHYSATVGTDGKWSTPVPATDLTQLTNGSTPVITANVADKAGNAATPATHDMQVDTHIDTTTVALSDGGKGANFDRVINAAEKTHAEISGTIDSTATLTLLTISDGHNTIPVPLASVAVTLDGHFTATGVDVSSLADGTLTVTATAVDPAGNESSNTGSALMDTAPPVAPHITPIPAGHDKTPTLSGTGEVGSTITFVDGNGNTLGSTVVNSAGTFTFTPSTDLPDGGKVTATSTDIHGNTSAPTTVLTHIDTHIAQTAVDITDGTTGSTAHPNHQISADELHAVSIAGSIDRTDGTETLTTLTVTDSAGTKVKLDIKQVTFDSKTGIFSIEKLDLSGHQFVDGQLTVEATAQDAAGNISSVQGLATLDKTPGTLSFDNTLSGDNIVNAKEAHSPLTISGTTTGIEAGQIVDVTLESHTYHATVDASGHWVTTVPQTDVAKLPEGDLVMQAEVHDLAGNNTQAISRQLSVDTAVKPPKSVTFESTGQDNLYNIKELGPDGTVTATIALPDDVKAGDVLTINGVPHPITDQDILHTEVTTPVTPTTTVTVSITDQAGNTSSDVSNTAAGSDLTPPSVPVLLPIANADHNKDNTPEINGITEANAKVDIYIDGTVVGTVTANSKGSFTYTPPTLPDGLHSFTAIATDAAGNPSTFSAAVQTTIDTTLPAQLGVSLETDTGASSTDKVTQTGTLHIQHHETGSQILYSVDHGTTWSNSFTPVEDHNEVVVKQVDQAGNESKTTSLSFTLDTQVAAPGVKLKLDSGSSSIDHITKNGDLDVTGTEPGAHVEYSIDGGKHWVDTIGHQIDGDYTVLVRQTDVAGNVSGSTSISYTLDTQTDVDVAISDSSSGVFHGNHFLNSYEIVHNENTITGHMEVAGELTKLIISDAHQHEVIVDLNKVNLHTDGSFDISNTDLSSLDDGTLTVTATSKDIAGNTDTSSGTIFKDTVNEATDVTNSVKEEDITTISGQVNMEPDAHGSSSLAFGSSSLSGDIDGTYGTLHLNNDGTYTYDLNNADPKVQALGEGATLQDVLTYKTTDPAGNEKESHLTVTITGTNDQAVIAGVDTGDVTEGVSPQDHSLLQTDGQLTIDDIDTNTLTAGGEEQFVTQVAPASNTHNLGALTIDKAGHWQYQVHNDDQAVQALQEHDTHVDQFIVHSVDGTAHTIAVTITGTKDAPTIEVATGADHGAVIEQGSTSDGHAIAGQQTTTGQLVGHDVDTADTQAWSIVGTSDGTYGHISVDANGEWTYTLDNALTATQGLTQDQHVTESFTVRVTDSTGLTADQNVVIDVKGSNDQAQIVGTDIGSVKEDITRKHQLHTDGQLTISDVDSGEAHFQASTMLAGQNGHHGTLSIDEKGRWHYVVDNSLQAVQELKETDHIDDVFTVLSADGTEHTITVTINGTNDLPEIVKGIGDTGAVTEAGSHANSSHDKAVDAGIRSTSGTLTATEHDQGDPAHWGVAKPQGTYGHLSIDPDSGHWVYTLDNLKADSLHANQVVTETFDVTDTDSSNTPVSHKVVITITGSNDVPVITGTRAGSVTEAGGTANALTGTPSIHGTLSALDPDNNDGTLAWSVQGATLGTTVKEGTYGSISIDPHGHWVYTIDDSKDATQALTGKQSPKEHFTFLVTDSSGQSIKQNVEITVHGSNDNPVLSAYSPITFAEDSTPAHSQSHVQTVVLPKVTDVDDSTFTYSIDSHLDHGNHNNPWITIDSHTGVISVHTDAKDLQHLSVGATHTEDVVVTVKDAQGGTTQQTLHLTISGTNDAPTITSAKITANQDEHGNPSAQTIGSDALNRVDVIEDHVVSGVVQFSDIDDNADPSHPTGDTHEFFVVDSHGHNIDVPGFILDKNSGSFMFDTSLPEYQHLQVGETEHVDLNIKLVDRYGAESIKTLHFVLHGQNDAPEVVQLHPLQVLEDTTLKFSVGDLVGAQHQYIRDPEGDAMAISEVKVVAGHDGHVHGAIVDLGMGNYQFKPDANYHGDVQLQYKIDDGRGSTVVKNGVIVVTPQNDAPTQGSTQLAHVAEDSGAITFTVQELLANIHDIDNVASSNSGIELVLGSVTLEHGEGKLVDNHDDTWTFIPDPDWNSHKGAGDAKFAFKYIETGTAFGQVSGAPVEYAGAATIKIDPVQDPATIHIPRAPGVITAGGADITGKLTVTDPDLNEDHFKAESSIQGAHGFAKINTLGEWQYQLQDQDPKVQALGEGEVLTDTIRVHSVDGTEASLVIEIHGTNDQPTIALAHQITATEANLGDQFTTEPKLVTGHFAATDPDAHDTVTFTLLGHSGLPTSHFKGNTVPGLTVHSDGSYSFDRTDVAYNYLQEGETLSFDITIQASDGHGGVDTRVVPMVIIGTNDAPEITQQIDNLGTIDSAHSSLRFDESTLLQSATDPDGDLLSIFKVGTSQNADVQVLDSTLGHIDEDGAGGYIYHPTASARGKDVAISYKVTDGTEVVVGHTVIHVDPLPTSTGSQTPTPTHTGNNNVHSTPPVITDTDVISGDLTGDVGEDGTSYKDSSGHTHVADIDGHVSAKSPSESHAHGVSGANHTPGQYGYLSVTPAGDWQYHLYSHTGLTDPVNQLSEGETLTDSISVTSAHSGHQDITITIHGSNDVPIIMGVENVQVFKQGSSQALAQSKAIIEVDKMHLEGDLKAQDPDSKDHVTYTLDPSNTVEGFSIDQHGHYQYTPTHSDAVLQGLKPGDTRDVTAQVLVSDGHGGDITVPVVLTVHGRNTAPTADKDVSLGNSDEDHVVQIDGTSIGTGQLVTHAGTAIDLVALAHAKDIDNDDLHVVNIKVDGGHGTFSDKGNGVYEFVPESNYHGSVGFTYEITDGLESTSVHATLTIDSVNDKPVAHDFALKTTDEDRAIHFTQNDIIGQGTLAAHGHVDDPDLATDSAEKIVLTDVSLVDPTQGTLASDGKGGYSFTPAKDVNGDIHLHYTVHDQLGSHQGVIGGQQSDSGTATIHVTPINDKPVITDSKHESSTEDDKSTFVAEGKLDISDADSGEGHFIANSHMTPNSGGNYGYLELDKQGHWKYHLMKNFDSHIQSLAAGEKLQEHFILHTDDGAGTTHELVVEIIGTNDGARISGTGTAGTMKTEVTPSVTEQLGSSATATATPHEITTSGTLTVHDVDKGEAGFKAQTLNPTNSGHHYGTLTIQQSGAWTYVVDNNNRDVQVLHEGEQIQEHFTVTSLDGTATQDVIVTLVGKNNAPVIADIATQSTDEGAGVIRGQLHSSDIDNDAGAVTYSLEQGAKAPAGFHLNSDGSYTFDSTVNAYDALAKGETLPISVKVVATDASSGVSESKAINIVVTGTNDPSVIGGQDTTTVTDAKDLLDGATSQPQTLTVADVDHNENSFIAETDLKPHTAAANGLSQSAYGHLSINSNGQWQYHVDHADKVRNIPDGQQVIETFTVQSKDGTNHTVTVTLEGKNEAAQFAGQLTGNVTDGHSTTAAGTLTVTDEDHGETGKTTAETNIQPSSTTDSKGHSTNAYGHLDIDEQGQWTYTVDNQKALQALPENSAVKETFHVHAADGTEHDVVITLTGTDDAPTITGSHAVDVTDTALQSSVKHLHVSDADTGQSHFKDNSHVSADSSTASGGADQTHHGAYGHLSIKANGRWQYHVDDADAVKAIPDGETVTETFTVHTADSTTQTITVTLEGKNEAATFKGDLDGTVTDGQSTSVTGTVQVSDVDYGQAGLTTAQNHLAPSNTDIQHHTGLSTNAYGHLSVESNGHWAYHIDDTAAFNSIADGQKVIETFAIEAKDGTHHNIVITLIGSNDAPTVSGAVAMQQRGTEDRTITLNQSQLLSHAVDVDNADHLTVVNVQASHGTIKVDQHGKILYTPDANYHGSETFTYDVKDSKGATVHTQASMQIDSVNDAPTVAHSVTLTGINEDTHSSIDASALLAGASDADHDSLSILNNSVSADHGRIQYDSNSHTYTYRPNANFHGQDTLHYQVSDDIGGTVAQTATIDVASVNDSPTVSNSVALPASAEDTSVTITTTQLIANAHDDDGDTLHISQLTASHGSLLDNHDGTWRFTPDQNYNGRVDLSYQVDDGHGGQIAQSATMTVTPENDAAQIQLNAAVDVDNAHNLITGGTLTISDPDGAAEESFRPETGLQGQFGELEMSADGQFKYTLNSHQPAIEQLPFGQTTTDSVTVHSQDGTEYVVVVNISGQTEHAPSVSQHVPIALTTSEHHQFSSADFAFNDADGDALDHITITQLPTHGELTLHGQQVQANQSVSAQDIDQLLFTADNHDTGPVTFDFTASDGHSDSAQASMTISVSPAPVTTPPITPASPMPSVSSDEPVFDTPIETVSIEDPLSLESLAASSNDGHPIDGAQAYLDQLGVSDDIAAGQSFTDHQPSGDLDLVLAQADTVTVDVDGIIVTPTEADSASVIDDEHKQHDDIHQQEMHQTEVHHQWDDSHHG